MVRAGWMRGVVHAPLHDVKLVPFLLFLVGGTRNWDDKRGICLCDRQQFGVGVDGDGRAKKPAASPA